MVRVPAYAGGEGAWEPRGGNASPSALVSGESGVFPSGKRIQVGARMIVIRPEAGKRLRGVFIFAREQFSTVSRHFVEKEIRKHEEH